MEKDHKQFLHPLSDRYASEELKYFFSPHYRIKMWRKVWIALAEAEKELGLPISNEQISQLKKFADNINFDVADKREQETKHDVMAHVYAYSQQCPDASKIIHLGATSALVTDNADILIIKDVSKNIISKLGKVINLLSELALKYKNLPALAYTHFQSAQLTTLGKRFSLWLQDLIYDYHELNYRYDNLALLGTKGATGTQASFLKLFDGDENKVETLDKLFCEKLGFKYKVALSGQTYSRKLDYNYLSSISSIAVSAAKFSNDMRLMQHTGEVSEGFEKDQIGSSAMPYKRNPIHSERIFSLSRLVLSLVQNASYTAANQWFERTLDDSANRRIIIPEIFLTIDAILLLYYTVVKNIHIREEIIEQLVIQELPFMATENILMLGVKHGGNRQELHEVLRQLSQNEYLKVKQRKENNLIKNIKEHPAFSKISKDIDEEIKAEKFIGMSAVQVENFIKNMVNNVLKEIKDNFSEKDDDSMLVKI